MQSLIVYFWQTPMSRGFILTDKLYIILVPWCLKHPSKSICITILQISPKKICYFVVVYSWMRVWRVYFALMVCLVDFGPMWRFHIVWSGTIFYFCRKQFSVYCIFSVSGRKQYFVIQHRLKKFTLGGFSVHALSDHYCLYLLDLYHNLLCFFSIL